MKKLDKDVISKLLEAMDTYKSLAEKLIDKLITETDQPEKEKITEGNYYEIENADLLNGNQYLTDNWFFDVHGEHCMFENRTTGQILEVSLGDIESVGNIDPYFFYKFLETTKNLCYLTEYFEKPFDDTLLFLRELEKQKKVVHVYRVEFRKI